MHSRSRIAHGLPYSEMDTTEEAEPTITKPITHKRATATARTVAVGNSWIVATSPAVRGPLALFGGALVCGLASRSVGGATRPRTRRGAVGLAVALAGVMPATSRTRARNSSPTPDTCP